MKSFVFANAVRARAGVQSQRRPVNRMGCAIAAAFLQFGFSGVGSAEFVVDSTISKSASDDTIRLMHRDRIATFGDIVATHFAAMEYKKDGPPGTHYLALENTSTGERSTVTLPGMSHIAYPFTDAYQLDQSGQYVTVDFAGHVMTSERDLWILAQKTDVDGLLSNLALKHYRLEGSPMPTAATLVTQHPFGDQFSRAHGLIRLESGALMATWFQHADGAGTDELVLGFGYRSSAGDVSVNWPVQIPPGTSTGEGRYSKSRYAAAQHPVTKDVWVFSKRDSSGQLQAVRLTEATVGLVIAEIMPSFISRADNDKDGPEGEWPDLHARALPGRETIQLMYHRNDYQIWTGTSDSGIGWFKKGARLGVAEIDADGTIDFATQRFPDLAERVTRFGMSATDDATWVLYQRVDGTYPVSTVSDYAVRFDNNERTWGTPIRVADARSSLGEFGVARAGVNGSHRFATRLRDDGQLHHITIGTTTPTPWLSMLEHIQFGDQQKLRWTFSNDTHADSVTVLRDSRGGQRYFERLTVVPESDGIRWSADVDPCAGCTYRLAGIDDTKNMSFTNVITEGGAFTNEIAPEVPSAPPVSTPPSTTPADTPSVPVEPEPQQPVTPEPVVAVDPEPASPPETAPPVEEPEVVYLDAPAIFDSTQVSRSRVRLKWHTVPFAHAYHLERGALKNGIVVWKKIATTYGSRAKFRDKRNPGTWWYRVKAWQFTNELLPAYSPVVKVVVR